MFVIIAIVVVSVALALGAGGGGGSPSSAPTSVSNGGGDQAAPADSSWSVTAVQANIYRTSEYNAQWGLEAIHAAEAYASLAKNTKVVAGEGIKIAILDTGAQENHFDIAGNLSAIDDHNYSKNSDDVADTVGAGTYAASLAAGVKNNLGVHGVAYDSSLVIADIYNDAGTVRVANTGISGSATIDSVKVINAGWKYDSYTSYNGTPSGTNAGDRDVIAAIKIAQSHDILLIAATGNDADNNLDGGGDSAYISKPKPAKPALLANNNELSGYVLAVGAVDQNFVITDSSNICGITHEYCLVAPGSDIKGAASDTNIIGGVGDSGAKYTTISSTYAAAAQVSGAAAVLRAAWPSLTAPQVANILLTTATDLGAPGDDIIYGHGLLNLYAAVQAQGSNNFAYGASISQTSYDVRSASIISDPIFGDAFTHNVAPALQNGVFFDDYGRDYKAFLGNKIAIRGRSSAINSLSNNIRANNYKNNIIPLSFGAKNSVNFSQFKFQIKSYTDIGKKFANIDKSIEDKALSNGNGFSFMQNISQKSQLGFAFNVDEIKNLSFEKLNNFGFISVNVFAVNPYQSFIASPYQSSTSTKNFNQIFLQHKLFGEKLKFSFSHQTSYESSSVVAQSNKLQNQISDFNFNYTPSDQANFMFSFGSLNEFNNNLLNSRAVGAFESGGNAKTSYFKIAISQKVYKNLSLVTNFSEGVTKVSGNNLGIFRDYQNIKSRSAAIGMISENIFNGRLGALYSEPLRVYSGKVAIDVPIARDNAGNVTHYNADISLKPQGRERNFEIFYAKNLTNFSQISLNFLTTKDAGNIKSDSKAYLSAINYNVRF